MYDIKGKTAVITGGTSGIGLATAKAFLEKGAKVVISGRNAEHGEKALESLKDVDGDLSFYQADASDPQQVQDLIKYAANTYGSLDIMFNNAGIANGAPVDKMADEDFNRLISINLTGVFYGIKYAAQEMEREGHGGAIVNTSSVEGYVGDPNLPAYNSAKGGVNLLTKSAALSLAKKDIRVNSVNPGFIQTGMVNEQTVGKQGIDRLVSLHPLGRLGKPEEIAHGVVFLVENTFTTGLNLYIDGGYTAQ